MNIISFKRPSNQLDHSWELNYRNLLSVRRNVFNNTAKLLDMSVEQDEKPESIHLVAKKEDIVVGCASIIRSELAGNYWRLRMIGVKTQFKNSGVGRALIQSAIENYKTLGSGLWVAVPEQEKGFFSKFGFTEFEYPKTKETEKLITMKLT